MSEASGITKQASDGAKAVADTAKKHYVAFGLVVVGVAYLCLKFSDKLKSALPDSVRKALGLTALALVGAAAFFGFTGDASAATHICCAEPASALGGSWSDILTGILGMGGAGGALMGSVLIGNTAPDIREAKLESGDKFKTYAQAGYSTEPLGPAIDFYVDGEVNVASDGRPMVATDQVLEVTCTIDQAPDTDTIFDDDIGRIVASVKMEETKLLGCIQDDTVSTGSILKNVLEFFKLGFNRGADAPVAKMTANVTPSTTHNVKTFTRYFTMPHANRLLANPMDTGLWLKLINKMNVRVQMASPSCLDSVSTGALLTGNATVKLTTPFVPHEVWAWPKLNQDILEKIAGGTGTVTLRKFGEKNASGSEPVDYLYAILRLSNLAGLPGNMTVDTISQIDCEKLGINRLQNVPAWLKPRLEAQVVGRAPISSVGYDENGNYQQGAVVNGLNVADLKWLALKSPSLGMRYQNMKRVGPGYELPISYTYAGGSNPSGEDAYVEMSIRLLSMSCGPRLAEMSGGKLDPANRDSVVHYTGKKLR